MPRLVFSTAGAERVRQYQEEFNRTVRDGKKAYDDTNMSVQQLDRATRTFMRQNETDQEKYNRLVGTALELKNKQKISEEKYREAIKKINDEVQTGTGRFKSLNEQSDGAFGAGAVAKLATYAAGLVSVQKVLGIINEEMRDNQRLVDAAEATKMTVGASREELIKNMAGVTPQDTRLILDQDKAIADRLKISERFVNLARGQALSKTSGDIAASLSATEAAMQYFISQPETAAEFAGVLGTMIPITGQKDALVNLGLMRWVGAASSISDLGMQARNIPPGLIGMVQQGFTPQEASAVYAGLSVAGGDTRGAVTSTGGINLGKSLREFDFGLEEVTKGLADAQKNYSEAAQEDLGGVIKLREFLAAEKTLEETKVEVEKRQGLLTEYQGLTAGERLKFLQARPEFAEQFVAGTSWQVKMEAPIRSLLTDVTSEVFQMVPKLTAKIPGLEGLRAEGQAGLAAAQQFNTLFPEMARRRAITHLAEQYELQQRAALSTEERQAVRDVLRGTGASALGAKAADFIAGITDEGMGLTIEGVINALQMRRREILTQYQGAAVAPTMGGEARRIALSDEDKNNAQRLQKAIEDLTEIARMQLRVQEQMSQQEGGLTGVPQ